MLPKVSTQEARDALAAMNEEYNYPANPANCARYGWEAARRYLRVNNRDVQAELDYLRAEVRTLRKESSDNSWILNPDRQGGAFTPDERTATDTWK